MFDVIIIGAGSGGLNIASFMNRAGFKVLLIDKSDASIGGDCLNFGCVPSKALIHTARTIHQTRHSKQFGVHVSGTANIHKIKAYIKSKQDLIRKRENAKYFRDKGMTVVLGPARFSGRHAVTVNGKTYRAKKIVLATGSRPRKLTIEGVKDVKNIFYNETIFDIDFLPKNLLVVGAGPVGIELGQAFAYLGSKVSVVQKGQMFLNKEDPEIAQVLLRRLTKLGMQFHFNCAPLRFDGHNTLVSECTDGKELKHNFDAVFVGIGRMLNIEGLDLHKAGIRTEQGRIISNDYLQTTNKDVLLCGDIVGKHQFTHAAELHASIILKNFFSPFKKKLNTDYISWVTYTDPEIATFGLNENELQNRAISYEVIDVDMADDDRAIVTDNTAGRLKIFVSKDRILGGSMIAPNAGELFQELVLANSAGLDVKTLFEKIYPYPTASRINKHAVSRYFSKKLTKRAKRFLKILYH